MDSDSWAVCLVTLVQALEQVIGILDDCQSFGIIRSIFNADDMLLRLNAAKQQLSMALQLIPINETRLTAQRVKELLAKQQQMEAATFELLWAAEQQAADLRRMMDLQRSSNDRNQQAHGVTHEMLSKVLQLLQSASGGHEAGTSTSQSASLGLDSELLWHELEDLRQAVDAAHKQKQAQEEQYLQLAIQHIEVLEQQAGAPQELRCTITEQLFEDPVIMVESGQTYERTAIEEWLARGNLKDPNTGVKSSTATLQTNYAMRRCVDAWKQQHAAAIRQAVQQQKQKQPPTPKAASLLHLQPSTTPQEAVVGDRHHQQQQMPTSSLPVRPMNSAAAGISLQPPVHSVASSSSSSSSSWPTPQQQRQQQPQQPQQPLPTPRPATASMSCAVCTTAFVFTPRQRAQRPHTQHR